MLVAADDPYSRLPDQRLRHIAAGEPVLNRLVGHTADPRLRHGRLSQLICAVRDLCRQRNDQVVHLAFRPAGDAPLSRGRPPDERIQGWVGLAGQDELFKILGERPCLARGTTRQPAHHLDARHRVAVTQVAQRNGGQPLRDHVTVRIHAGGPGAVIEQAELTANPARPHERHHPVAVEVWALHLHPHLARDDEVTGITRAAFTHQAGALPELDSFQMRLQLCDPKVFAAPVLGSRDHTRSPLSRHWFTSTPHGGYAKPTTCEATALTISARRAADSKGGNSTRHGGTGLITARQPSDPVMQPTGHLKVPSSERNQHLAAIRYWPDPCSLSYRR